MNELRETGTEQDERHQVAVQIGLEVGLLMKCEVHGCVYDAMNDFVLDDALRCGDELMSRSDPLVSPFGGNRRRLHHAIEEVRSGMPNSCPDCYYAQFQS
jgi:hypothetical protein